MPHQNSHIQFGKDIFSNSIYSSKICLIIYNFFYLISLGYAAPYPCHPLAPSLVDCTSGCNLSNMWDLRVGPSLCSYIRRPRGLTGQGCSKQVHLWSLHPIVYLFRHARHCGGSRLPIMLLYQNLRMRWCMHCRSNEPNTSYLFWGGILVASKNCPHL
jgi:hypothetical protein